MQALVLVVTIEMLMYSYESVSINLYSELLLDKINHHLLTSQKGELNSSVIKSSQVSCQ